MKMSLISALNQALRIQDKQEVLRICRSIIQLKDYPESLRSYAETTLKLYCPESNDKAPGQEVSSHLNYNASYEACDGWKISDTYVKALAFYLPQFHRIPENDLWWGEGFTEWTNTSKSKPRFEGHYQPRVPHDSIGYYDLSSPKTIRDQSELAKKAKLDGFCFYYYWFSGRRLLETPIQNLFNTPDIDIEYVICWANENWTRTWDGLENEALICQDYRDGWEVDFISDTSRYFSDTRYVRIDGKPVIIVYKLLHIPSPQASIEKWRDWCKASGIGEISVWAVYDVAFLDMQITYIDRFVEFPPRQVGALQKLPNDICEEADCHLYNYKALVQSIVSDNGIADKLDFPIYRTAMMGWDNSARRDVGFSIWIGYSTDLFYHWCKHIWHYTVCRFGHNERFLFVNAWNEWAEGSYLEPDKRFGYANLNALSRALLSLPNERFPVSYSRDSHTLSSRQLQKDWSHSPGSLNTLKICIHVHLYYAEVADPILERLHSIPIKFDLYITICDSRLKSLIYSQIDTIPNMTHGYVIDVPNRGRDIAPFIVELRDTIPRYDLFLHLHSKRSESVWWGDQWRNYLLDNTLGSPEHILNILNEFSSDDSLGILSPPLYPPLKPHCTWGSTEDYIRAQSVLSRSSRMGTSVPELPQSPRFPAGSFFWARPKALAPIFDIGYEYDDFEPEEEMPQCSLAHIIERLWPYSASLNCMRTEEIHYRQNHHDTYNISNKRLCIHVFYSSDGCVGPEAIHYIQSLRDFSTKLILVNNSDLDEVSNQVLAGLADQIILRENNGFDFGAWRDVLNHFDVNELKEYDELVLTNSSCIGPFVPWTNVFNSMDLRAVDFWGLTIFPETQSQKRPEASRFANNTLHRHIQSFFMVFSRSVFCSFAFRAFWSRVHDESALLDVTASYEIGLTKYLSDSGFTYDAYCRSHEVMQDHYSKDGGYNAIYNHPYEMLLMGSPVIKNKFQAMWPGQLALVKEYVHRTGCYPSILAANWH